MDRSQTRIFSRIQKHDQLLMNINVTIAAALKTSPKRQITLAELEKVEKRASMWLYKYLEIIIHLAENTRERGCLTLKDLAAMQQVVPSFIWINHETLSDLQQRVNCKGLTVLEAREIVACTASERLLHSRSSKTKFEKHF